jgi:hypothetical protein
VVVDGTRTYTDTWYRHPFQITPKADGTFSYGTYAQKRVSTWTINGSDWVGPVIQRIDLQTGVENNSANWVRGTVTPTTDVAYGSLTGFKVVGVLPPAFRRISWGTVPEMLNARHNIDIGGTRTAATATALAGTTLAGKLSALDSGGATVSTMTIKSGSFTEQVTTSGGHRPASLAMDLLWAAGSAEFEGQISITGVVEDLSKTMLLPAKVELSGALRNSVGGVTTEFVSGKLSGNITGAAAFDVTKPVTATNSYTAGLSFVGTVTATARPTLEMSLGGTWIVDGAHDRDVTATLQYRSLVAGVPRLVVTLVGSRSSANSSIDTYKLSEATANLSMNWIDGGQSTVDLYAGTTKIGVLNAATGMLTFVDNTSISLDIGL